ncbi:MAG TPA: hypothetical protein VLE21_06305 [Candidatus Nitrosocosmicus sp.]|nr:hypothetical protein [Candidatus Nitrosocosmicus sp.]
MKTFINVCLPVIVAISLVLLLNTGSSNNIYGQIIVQTNQTNQTQPQAANQTQPQIDAEMNEKLLDYTNAAILALNDDNESAAQDSLVQIQNALINASGKQVVIIPAPAISSPSDDDDDGDSD